jgi:hypothetical protein
MAFPAPRSVEDHVMMGPFNDIGTDQYNIDPTILRSTNNAAAHAAAIFVSHSTSGPQLSQISISYLILSTLDTIIIRE